MQYQSLPVSARRDEVDALREEFFHALAAYRQGLGALPHALAARIPLRLDGRRWVQLASLDAYALRTEGAREWELLATDLRDAMELVNRWCPVPHRWRESGEMQTSDGPHLRHIRLFVQVADRDDVEVLRARLAMREALTYLRLPQKPKSRHKLSLVPPPAEGHLSRLREQRRFWNEVVGNYRESIAEHYAAAEKPALRAVGGSRR